MFENKYEFPIVAVVVVTMLLNLQYTWLNNPLPPLNKKGTKMLDKQKNINIYWKKIVSSIRNICRVELCSLMKIQWKLHGNWNFTLTGHHFSRFVSKCHFISQLGIYLYTLRKFGGLNDKWITQSEPVYTSCICWK